MTTHPDCNEQVLASLHRLGGDRLLRRMLELFLEHAPQRIASARTGLQEGDLDAVRRATHSLKSTAGNVGAVVMEELAGRIEQIAASQTDVGLHGLITDLEAAFTRLQPYLAAQEQQPDVGREEGS